MAHTDYFLTDDEIEAFHRAFDRITAERKPFSTRINSMQTEVTSMSQIVAENEPMMGAPSGTVDSMVHGCTITPVPMPLNMPSMTEQMDASIKKMDGFIKKMAEAAKAAVAAATPAQETWEQYEARRKARIAERQSHPAASDTIGDAVKDLVKKINDKEQPHWTDKLYKPFPGAVGSSYMER